MKIDNITLARIKDAASIVDVIGDFYDLHRKGRYYECLCPFHNDHHTGSFKIDPKKNSYICWSCGAHGDAIEFLMRHENLTFFEAVAWLGKKYGIDVEGGDRFTPRPAKPRPKRIEPQLPPLTLPLEYALKRMDTSHDTLCNWIRSLNWNDKQRGNIERVFKDYAVGHSRVENVLNAYRLTPKEKEQLFNQYPNLRNGHTIFWQIAEDGNLRTGKFMLYKPDGHRDKKSKFNFTFAHTLLWRAGLLDLNKFDDSNKTTYFGMHLLTFHPNATVCIVESEKTAILASIMWGHPDQMIWMACGGKSFITRQKLQPIIDQERKIILFPDRDAVKDWSEMAEVVGYKGLQINKKFITDYWRESDGPKADIGDIIVASLTERRTKPQPPPYKPPTPSKSNKQLAAEALQRMIDKNPNIKTLVEKLNLEPITISHSEWKKKSLKP